MILTHGKLNTMTWKINCKEKITSEYILYLYHLLKKYMPERYSNAKLVLMQAKAKQFTNVYSLEKKFGRIFRIFDDYRFGFKNN